MTIAFDTILADADVAPRLGEAVFALAHADKVAAVNEGVDAADRIVATLGAYRPGTIRALNHGASGITAEHAMAIIAYADDAIAENTFQAAA